MRRSRRYQDEWADRSADAERVPGDTDRTKAFIETLRSSSTGASEVDDSLIEGLAAEARSVAQDVGSSRPTRGRTTQPLIGRWRRRAMIGTFISTLLGKVAVGIAATSVATSGLAVTGNLPEPAQQWASDTMSEVGIELPAPGERAREEGIEEGIDERQQPELPEETADTARDVTDEVFEGDPLDGAEYGEGVADTATEGTEGADRGSDLPEEVPDIGDEVGTDVPVDLDDPAAERGDGAPDDPDDVTPPLPEAHDPGDEGDPR